MIASGRRPFPVTAGATNAPAQAEARADHASGPRCRLLFLPRPGCPQPDRPVAIGPRRPCRGPARLAHRPGPSRPDPRPAGRWHLPRPAACASGRPFRARRHRRLAFSVLGKAVRAARARPFPCPESRPRAAGPVSWKGRWYCSPTLKSNPLGFRARALQPTNRREAVPRWCRFGMSPGRSICPDVVSGPAHDHHGDRRMLGHVAGIRA